MGRTLGNSRLRRVDLARRSAYTCSAWVLAAVTALLASACRQAPVEPPKPLTDAAERGPLRLDVRVQPPEIWLGDTVHVELSMLAPERTSVRFPKLDRTLGDAEVHKQEDAPPAPQPDGRTLWRRTIVLEPMASGAYELPPQVVAYGPAPADPASAEAFEQELATGTLKVVVRSALTSQDSVAAPRDITGVLDPPRRPWPLWLWAALLGGAALVLAGLWAAWRAVRRWSLRPAPPIAPEVWALQQLEQLSRETWLESNRVREYYYRLSEVVREYIERKFALKAPEMTTEEFLTTLSRQRGRLPYDAGKLSEFMNACDLVKYAAFVPRKEDGESALSTARAFIHTTAAAAEHAAQQARGAAEQAA
jgi:hypothetical protein